MTHLNTRNSKHHSRRTTPRSPIPVNMNNILRTILMLAVVLTPTQLIYNTGIRTIEFHTRPHYHIMPSYYSQLGRGRGGGNARGGEGGRRHQGRGGRDGRGSTARYELGSSGSAKGSKYHTFKSIHSKAGTQRTGTSYIAATNASNLFQYLDSRADDLMDTEKIQWDTIGEIIGNKPGAVKHQIVQHILDTIPTFKNCVEVNLSASNNVLCFTKIDVTTRMTMPQFHSQGNYKSKK